MVGVCHSVDVGTLQAMLTEHLELDITLKTGGRSHTSLITAFATVCLLGVCFPPSPPQMNLVHDGGCIYGISAELWTAT